MSDDVIGMLFAVLERNRGLRYGEQDVGMVDHMLQTAALAQAAGAADALVAAALFHDIGHFGTDIPDGGPDARHTVMLEQRIDRAHEAAGARLLEGYFGPAVTEPVRLHVAAKRYLSALDAGYADTLAPAARHTLTLQGGSFTGDECRAFDRQPGSADALALRRFDDRAVVPGVQTPVLAHYRPLLESLLQR
jgi:gamma-butyrobetaine dioxygenase